MRPADDKSMFENYRAKFKTCTDKFWFCFFFVVLIALITIAIIAFVYGGNYLPIINGYDSYGNTCGVKNNKRYMNYSYSGVDTSDKPHLLYFDFYTDPINGVKLCVEGCPNTPLVEFEDVYSYYKSTNHKLCRYDMDMDYLKKSNNEHPYNFLNRLGPCPIVMANMSVIIRNRCAPCCVRGTKLKYQSLDEIESLKFSDWFQLFFVYVFLTRNYIAALIGIAFIISIVLVVMMHWLTRVISFLICLMLITANSILCAELWHIYASTRTATAADLARVVEEFRLNNQVIYWLSVLVSVTMVVLLLILFFLRNQIFKLNTVFDEAAYCLANLPVLLIAPSITLVLLMGSFWFSIYVLLCITTASYPEIVVDSERVRAVMTTLLDPMKSYEQIQFIDFNSITNLFWVYAIGFMWTSEFIIACEEFVLGAAVMCWYFKKPTTSPLTFAVNTLLKHHLGTVVKGSMAWDTFSRNAPQIEPVNRTVDVIFFLAKLLVAITTCLTGIFIVKDVKDMYFYMAPVILSTVIAFFIAHVVFALSEMIVDTIFLCICEDKETYGYGGRWTKSNLAKFLDNKDAKPVRVKVAYIKSVNTQPINNFT